jgi:hypothetical protein
MKGNSKSVLVQILQLLPKLRLSGKSCFLLITFSILFRPGFTQSAYIDLKEGMMLYELGLSFSYAQSNYLISGLDVTLIRAERFDPDLYSTSSNPRKGNAFFVQLPVQLHKYFFIRPMIGYEWHRDNSNSDFSYEDVLGLEYDIWLNYSYLRFGGELGFSVPLLNKNKNKSGYLHNGLSIQCAFGITSARNLTPGELIYISNDSNTGPDSQIQLNLREVLEGRSVANKHISATLSYKGLFFQFIKFFNNEDVLTTKANEYDFVDNKNTRTGYWMLGLGLSLPLISCKDYKTREDKDNSPSGLKFVDPFLRKY